MWCGSTRLIPCPAPDMKRLRRRSGGWLHLGGLGFLLWLAAPSRGAELFPPARFDEVSVRTLPAFTVLETESTGSIDEAWSKGFRFGARYAVQSGSGLNTPTIITFPDWEKSPTAQGGKVHVLVQCLLDPLPDLPRVKDGGSTLRNLAGMTVACYAQSGNYSAAAFASGLEKIEGYVKAHHLAQSGPPRYLYYVTTSWMPSWWRIGEVQVPIAVGAGG